ncbi:MAG: NAD(P)/FAD-dependent oxidoreductase [Candidatus Methanospirareceae archaeon]
MKVVIVGGGAAGVSAIETIRRLEEKGMISEEVNITMVTEDKKIYSPCIFPYFLADEVDEDGVLFRDVDFYERMRVRTIFKRAGRVDTERKRVILEDGGEESYDKLLIATGSSPISPQIKGMDKEGVFFFHSFKDVRRVKEWMREVRRVVVIGAGFIGTEVAISLNKKGKEVSLVEIRDRVLPEMLEGDIAEKVKERMEGRGIRVILNGEVREIEGDDRGRVRGVVVRGHGKEERIVCEMVIVAVGVSPNIDIVKGTRIRTNAGIVVDDKMRTSEEDVYAAGDVAETTDIITRERRINAIWMNAIKQGRVAAYNMLGIERRYEGSYRFNVIDVFGLVVVMVGHLLEGCEEISTKIKSGMKRVMIKDNRIVKMTIMGDIRDVGKAKAGVISNMMWKGGLNFKDIIKEDLGYAKVIKHMTTAYICAARYRSP